MASDSDLEEVYRLVSDTILERQHAVTGLLPADGNNSDKHAHAWVRDNVYGAYGLFGLFLVYRKRALNDDYHLRELSLRQHLVKLMRSLLLAMMNQVEKVEAFKKDPSSTNALHAKYSCATCKTVVADWEWGHLQIDATSLFLLALAQMTATGIEIIYNLDEVDFIQNLVFYIEAAYRTPDYGIWERGQKINQGVAELNTSSVGLAKAALVALNDMDLFGAKGGKSSVIHVLSDEVQRCKTMVHSLVPRGSLSKELDASVVMALSFPAFAVEDEQLIDTSMSRLLAQLEGRYGLKRFLRDGYKTAAEDPSRLHYDRGELKLFENVECEWPVFFCFLILDGYFRGKPEQVEKYRGLLDNVLQTRNIDGNEHRILPEMYTVPKDNVNDERQRPGSQDRVPEGKEVFVWGQAVLALTQLLDKGFLTVSELDPLNMRMATRRPQDVVVQVALIADDEEIAQQLQSYGLPCDSSPSTVVLPARRLSKVYEQLGRNAKLQMSGRPNRSIGVIGTSKLYRYHQSMFAFVPAFLDQEQFYLCLDIEMMVDMIETELAYLRANWRVDGRPTVSLPITRRMLTSVSKRRYTGAVPLNPDFSPIRQLLEKFKSGFANGVRVILGNLDEFISTSCIRELNFLEARQAADTASHHTGSAYSLDSMHSHVRSSPHDELLTPMSPRSSRRVLVGGNRRPQRRNSSVSGMIRKSRQAMTVNVIPESLQLSTDEDTTSPTGISRKISDPLLQMHISEDTIPSRPTYGRMSSQPSNAVANSTGNTPNFSSMNNVSEAELVVLLQCAESIEEQSEAVHFLATTKGPEWELPSLGEGTTVAHVVEEIYEQAGQLQHWSLIRHMAGLRKKRVDELAEAAADLLVQQKQFSFGLGTISEEITVDSPLPSEEIKKRIYLVYGNDYSAAALAQELLVYLAMFIRSEPALFNSMLRLRISLIMRVMASELARKTSCDARDASDQLINLTPFEMKALLHFILSGKEFLIEDVVGTDTHNRMSVVAKSHRQQPSIALRDKMPSINVAASLDQDDDDEDNESDEADQQRHGEWLRRRQLDGALNRVPCEFYTKAWRVLDRCAGIIFGGHEVTSYPTTSEMTAGELKFAVALESTLNCIPMPEYRQLMVEALMVLSIVCDNDPSQVLDGSVNLDEIVHNANELFLRSQLAANGDATQCCCADGAVVPGQCGAAKGICVHFYDCAPSGRYGTLSYISQAVIRRCRRSHRVAAEPHAAAGPECAIQ